MNQVIEIVISKTGQAVVETKGYMGSSCKSASRFIENALGRATKQTHKPEFFQSLPLRQQNHQ